MERQLKIASEEEKIRTFILYQSLITQRSPKPIQRVIDIGCSAPQFWRLWFYHGIGIWGVDFSLKQHTDPKQLAEATVVYTEVRKMWPLVNNFFDAATIIDIPLLYSDPMPIISQANRLLKKNGVLLVVLSQDPGVREDSEVQQSKYKRPEYWFGLLGGLGFHRIQMRQYFTYIFPPFSLFQKLFRAVGLPVREHMVPVPARTIAKRYIFIAQK